MAAQCRAKTMPQKSKSLAKPRLTHHLPPLLLSIVFLILVTGRIEAAGNDVISVAAANAAETSTLRRPMILRLKREINVMNMDDDDNDNDNDEDDNGGVGVSVGGANDKDNDDEEATLMDTEQQPRSKQTTQKADRDFDFAAYINDFNLQEEASIPEDIFDQHDGDIEDAASVPTADDESDADIILESQRPTSRNFSVYLETAKKYPKNNYKLRNNKEANTKSTTNVSNGQRENEKGNGKAKEQTDANFGRKSFAYKKLKNMHEQKQQQQQLKQKDDDEDEDDEEDELDKEMEEQEQEQEQEQEEQENEEEIEKQQRRQLFDSIEIFNERKFNKPFVNENHDEIEKEPETEQLHEEDGDILAIGDIEDNFSNSNDEVADNVDNDKLAATSIPTTTTYSPTSTASSTTTTTTTTTRDTMTTTTPSTSVPFIGKKLKRRYYDLGHMQSKPTETSADNENDKMKENQQDLTLGELHYYDATQNLEHKLPNYFGRTLTKKNRTNIERFVDDDYSEQEPPQDMDKPQNVASIADIYYQEDAMTTTTAAVPTFAATTTTTPPPPPYSSYPYMYTQTSSYSTPSPSAFERFKALRRSNHRNGHKSHKKRYKDYLRHHSAANEMVSKHMQKLRKEQQQQQQQDAPHAAPIFALGIRPQRPTIVTPKPFYEGQVNYYDQAQDNDSNEDLEHHTEMQRLIAHDNGNWYRRISPVLRNGIKSSANNGPEQLSSSANSLSLRHHVKQLEPPHHHPYHHQAHQHHHHHHHSHHQHGHNHHQHHHKPQRLPNPYQRKLSPPPPSAHPSKSPSLASSITPPPAPLPPPKQQLGHQITELEQLERYYAKWPHLARVQFQIYDEHYRESHPDLYPDYEEDYETAAEMEEAQQEHGDEANLPPYIKKYNRRNKQLLNLLEGTLPPPSPPPLSISAKETRAGAGGGEIAPRLVWSKSVLQPGPHQSAPVATQPLGIHLDDDYLKQKRRRYHQQHREENLFAQQQQQQPRSSTTTMASPTIASVTSTGLPNQLPEEDLEQGASPFDYWNSRAGIAAVGEAVRDGDGASTSTAKPALYKLPSYPAITSSFLGTPRSRSRSAQFVANVSGRGQSSWRQTDAIQSTMENNATMRPPPPPAAAPPSSPLNSFVYHRVNDGGPDSPSLPSSAAFASSSSSASSSPSSSLSSSLLSSRKQRLPFVAITDRRLETLGSKKLLAERHKDFEQNHFPLP